MIVQLPDGIALSGFSLLVGLGAAIGLSWSVWQTSEERRWTVVEAGLWALFGALLGGRAGYVLVNWAYFQAHIGQALQPQLGGLAWPGALAGGLLALAIYCVLNHTDLGSLADDLTPLLGILACSLWLGCWLDGCAYGITIKASIMPESRNEWGQMTQRWPVQLIGAGLTLVWFGFVNRLGENLRPGLRASLGLLGLAVIQFYLSQQRADPGLEWNGLRLDIWIAAAFVGLALIGLLIFEFRRKQRR